ncbi:hypothetical protein [Clostridium sp. AF32-12BH]|uniref:hypothetical protein n=1 Tax=Clostridium sp. AF32-12BH TaxID=2292006 RepID=UPI000E4AEFD9|nr:hypothetical protein [Clostridium sp. AF32-12BH]RHP47059.1 hypothetical protein DWZ40_09155 [Clostridium sp. AF32-12BH]
MGKARSYEIIEYRKKIFQAIVDSPELVKLLGEEDSEDPAETIPYNKSFPHEFVPDTITSTDKYVNFDMVAYLDTKNNVFKDITVYFYVVCHKAVVRMDKHSLDLWYDKVTCALDDIFSQSDILGIGNTMQLVSNVPYLPHKDFKGRLLKFTVKDFKNGAKYGA